MSAIHDALEMALTIFIYCFLTALIASGVQWPPSAPALFPPLLFALLAAVGAYAGARKIQLPPERV